jgi:biopolymer transport protein ExbD
MSELESSSGKPNLTPILDMVFQLITFFMLVMNFKAAALDTSLRLPVVGSARAVDAQGQVSLLILNITREGNLNVYGQSRTVESYIAGEAQAELLAARQKNPKLQPGDELPTTVVIRADRGTEYHMVHRVIEACQQHGFRNFALKALNREEG